MPTLPNLPDNPSGDDRDDSQENNQHDYSLPREKLNHKIKNTYSDPDSKPFLPDIKASLSLSMEQEFKIQSIKLDLARLKLDTMNAQTLDTLKQMLIASCYRCMIQENITRNMMKKIL